MIIQIIPKNKAVLCPQMFQNEESNWYWQSVMSEIEL